MQIELYYCVAFCAGVLLSQIIEGFVRRYEQAKFRDWVREQLVGIDELVQRRDWFDQQIGQINVN